MHAVRSLRRVALLAALFAALGSVAARAHPIVVSSQPAANAAVHGPTAEVGVGLNRRLAPKPPPLPLWPASSGLSSVWLRGLRLATQSLWTGGVGCLGLVVGPVAERLGPVGVAATARGRRLLVGSALTLACAELVFIVLECVVLAGTMD